jgi:hypothetical protein
MPQLIAEVLSDSAVVRPAPTRLESAATQHNDKPGANYNGEHEINSAHCKAPGGERTGPGSNRMESLDFKRGAHTRDLIARTHCLR